MADVLLTHTYHLSHDAKQLRKMQPYPPLGTLYAATALRSAGISTAVFDTTFAQPVPGFREALEEHKPKIVVIYEDDFNFVIKMCLMHMRKLANELATIARSAGITVIAHGSDATDHPREYLDNGVDFILKGEAEQSLTNLCDALLQSRQLEAIPGLVRYSAADGRLESLLPAPTNLSWATLPRAERTHPPRAISACVDASAWLLLYKHGVEPRLSIRLQLVCEAHLWQSLPIASTGGGCGGDS